MNPVNILDVLGFICLYIGYDSFGSCIHDIDWSWENAPASISSKHAYQLRASKQTAILYLSSIIFQIQQPFWLQFIGSSLWAWTIWLSRESKQIDATVLNCFQNHMK